MLRTCSGQAADGSGADAVDGAMGAQTEAQGVEAGCWVQGAFQTGEPASSCPIARTPPSAAPWPATPSRPTACIRPFPAHALLFPHLALNVDAGAVVGAAASKSCVTLISSQPWRGCPEFSAVRDRAPRQQQQ